MWEGVPKGEEGGGRFPGPKPVYCSVTPGVTAVLSEKMGVRGKKGKKKPLYGEKPARPVHFFSTADLHFPADLALFYIAPLRRTAAVRTEYVVPSGKKRKAYKLASTTHVYLQDRYAVPACFMCLPACD